MKGMKHEVSSYILNTSLYQKMVKVMVCVVDRLRNILLSFRGDMMCLKG
jgi:hypothetical protein